MGHTHDLPYKNGWCSNQLPLPDIQLKKLRLNILANFERISDFASGNMTRVKEPKDQGGCFISRWTSWAVDMGLGYMRGNSRSHTSPCCTIVRYILPGLVLQRSFNINYIFFNNIRVLGKWPITRDFTWVQNMFITAQTSVKRAYKNSFGLRGPSGLALEYPTEPG